MNKTTRIVVKSKKINNKKIGIYQKKNIESLENEFKKI